MAGKRRANGAYRGSHTRGQQHKPRHARGFLAQWWADFTGSGDSGGYDARHRKAPGGPSPRRYDHIT